MYKQGDHFTEEEKKWLQKRYADEDVQALYKEGSNYHLKSADLLLGEYYERFGEARPAEDLQTYKKRLKNAQAARKPQIALREAEDEVKVEMRKDQAHAWIRQYLKDYHRRVKDKTVTREAPLPQMPKPRRSRRDGAIDAFRCSTLRLELIPEIPRMPNGKTDVGAYKKLLTKAFENLPEEQRQKFQEVADANNEQMAEEELAEAGSLEEVERARLVPSAGKWVSEVLHTLEQEIHWVGGVMLGGPDEGGKPKIRTFHTGTNRKGLDFFEALTEKLGWDKQKLYVFAMDWLLEALEDEAPPDDDDSDSGASHRDVETLVDGTLDATACADASGSTLEEVETDPYSTTGSASPVPAANGHVSRRPSEDVHIGSGSLTAVDTPSSVTNELLDLERAPSKTADTCTSTEAGTPPAAAAASAPPAESAKTAGGTGTQEPCGRESSSTSAGHAEDGLHVLDPSTAVYMADPTDLEDGAAVADSSAGRVSIVDDGAPGAASSPKKGRRSAKKPAPARKEAIAGAHVEDAAPKKTGAREPKKTATARGSAAAKPKTGLTAQRGDSEALPPVVPHPGLDRAPARATTVAETAEPVSLSRSGRVRVKSTRAREMEETLAEMKQDRKGKQGRQAKGGRRRGI